MAKTKNKTNSEKKDSPVKSTKFWRDIAAELIPFDKDDWHRAELAQVLMTMAQAMQQEWKKMSKICEDSEGAAVSAGFGFTIIRKETPPKVKWSLKYSEKHGTSGEGDVMDPAQDLMFSILEEAKQESAGERDEFFGQN